MAKSEEKKAARREKRAIARKEREERLLEMSKNRLFSSEGIICYKCQGVGYYAAECKEKRKSKGKERKDKRFRSEILCFKCHKNGHFFSHCPNKEKKSRAPTATVDGPTICFHCKQTGHIARNCSERQRGRQAVLRPARAKGLRIVREDGSMLYHCGNCKNWGHVDIECTSPFVEFAESVNTEESFLRRCGVVNKTV